MKKYQPQPVKAWAYISHRKGFVCAEARKEILRDRFNWSLVSEAGKIIRIEIRPIPKAKARKR